MPGVLGVMPLWLWVLVCGPHFLAAVPGLLADVLQGLSDLRMAREPRVDTLECSQPLMRRGVT